MEFLPRKGELKFLNRNSMIFIDKKRTDNIKFDTNLTVQAVIRNYLVHIYNGQKHSKKYRQIKKIIVYSIFLLLTETISSVKAVKGCFIFVTLGKTYIKSL